MNLSLSLSGSRGAAACKSRAWFKFVDKLVGQAAPPGTRQQRKFVCNEQERWRCGGCVAVRVSGWDGQGAAGSAATHPEKRPELLKVIVVEKFASRSEHF